MRISWNKVLEQAAEIVNGYDTGVTLRQLFYRLVSAGILPNTQSVYRTLSARTAEARRAGKFPDLIDRTRTIHRYASFNGVYDAKKWLAEIYRRDRTEGQEVSLYIGVEKNGLVAQIQSWFGDLGIPILALGGYSSQSYVDEVVEDVISQQRPAVLLYAGDFDPSGVDIDRDFIKRTSCFDKTIRIALNEEQIEKYGLPPQMGKATDTRAKKFVSKRGKLVQVELDALQPDVLRRLFLEQIVKYFDFDIFNKVLEKERWEREQLCL